MKLQTKKKTNTKKYPLLSFRVTEDEREEILLAIDKLKLQLNKNIDSKIHKKILGGDIAVEALRIGIKALRNKF